MGLLVTGVLIDDYPMYVLILPLMRHEIGLVLMVSCYDLLMGLLVTEYP